MRDRSWVASLTAVASVAAASLCCLPVVPLALAAGGASAAWFTASKFQPYLLGLSAACILYGFWQVRTARQCSTQRRAWNMTLLGIATVMTAGAILFPQAIANILTPGGGEIAGVDMPFLRLTGANQLRDAINLAPPDATIVVALFSPT
jgi:hypothetical protein